MENLAKIQTQYCEYLQKTITLILFIGFIPRYLPGEQPLYF